MLGVNLGGGFEFDDDELAARGDRERGEGCGILGIGVTNSADNSSDGTQEIILDENLAESWTRMSLTLM